MKSYISALVLGAMIWGAASAPASAEMGPDYDMRFELQYMPLRVSTSGPAGVCNANMPVIKASAEGRVYKGFILGGNYSFGSGRNMNIVGMGVGGNLDVLNCSDPQYKDLELYVKIPFNFESFIESDRVAGPAPAFSPLYGYIGYKNTSLKAHAPVAVAAYDKINVETSSGVGIGLGADLAFDPVGVYGQFVYYPCMITKNVGVDPDVADGKLYVIEWDAGVRSNFKDSPVQARIGYHYEQHKAKNIKLKYDGVQIAAVAQF